MYGCCNCVRTSTKAEDITIEDDVAAAAAWDTKAYTAMQADTTTPSCTSIATDLPAPSRAASSEAVEVRAQRAPGKSTADVVSGESAQRSTREPPCVGHRPEGSMDVSCSGKAHLLDDDLVPEEDVPWCCKHFPGHSDNHELRRLLGKDRRLINTFLDVDKNTPWEPIAHLMGSRDLRRYGCSVAGSPVKMFKGVATVGISARQLFTFFEDRLNWKENVRTADTMFKDGTIIGEPDAHRRFQHCSFKMPFGITCRDFVLEVLTCMPEEGTMVSLVQSVERVDVPEVSGCVRGEIPVSGYLARDVPGEPGRCVLTYIVQADPKGWLPKWVVNLVAVDQTENVARISAHFKNARRKEVDA